ncbi:MAG: FAD-dependent oxidoreductase [Bacteroidales bacterium]
MTTNYYDIVIIGGGPAGTGLLLKALKDGPGSKLFQLRIALIEKSDHLIKGVLTDYKINSDTLSDVFLECLEGAAGSFLDFGNLKEEIETIQRFKGRAIPLNDIETYYNKLGKLVKETLTQMNFCDFFMNSGAEKIVMKEDGTYQVFLSGSGPVINTRQVVMATGGIPNANCGNAEFFAGKIPLSHFAAKSIHSDHLMRHGIPPNLKTGLVKNPKVVILGGSHGGFSSAHILLNSGEKVGFSASGIKIWSTTLPKIYFSSKEEAAEHGYNDFTADDICPVTGRVFRLAGLRMDGRQLYMQMVGLNGYTPEERVRLNVFDDQENELLNDLSEAGLVILAFGYRFNMLPLFDKYNHPVKFAGTTTDHWVNEQCEMVDDNGAAIPGLFAMGLATGFIPSGVLGGEPSFTGQTNGIWYYQNILAEQIINQLQGENITDRA